MHTVLPLLPGLNAHGENYVRGGLLCTWIYTNAFTPYYSALSPLTVNFLVCSTFLLPTEMSKTSPLPTSSIRAPFLSRPFPLHGLPYWPHFNCLFLKERIHVSVLSLWRNEHRWCSVNKKQNRHSCSGLVLEHVVGKPAFCHSEIFQNDSLPPPPHYL